MRFRKSLNDPILDPFLSSKDAAQSERQLARLLEDHAESRIKGIVGARLHSYFKNYERHPDFEDIYSEVKTKIVTFLKELKEGPATRPCKDFRGYVAAITHNACHDYLRQMYPARTRLYKQIRDLLSAHPDFAIWRQNDEKGRNDWVCGFAPWQGARVSSKTADWIQRFYENRAEMSDSLSKGRDIHLMELDDLLAAVFNHIGRPISVEDVVSVIADIKGVKDLPSISFDSDGNDLAQDLSDSKLRIDSILEMREPLKRFWEALRLLPRDEFKVYTLYARDSSGEDIITLFLATRIVTEAEIAQLLEISIDQFRDLWLNRLPLDNESIAHELGIKIERVYKLRFQAGKRLKIFLSSERIKV
jgi:RNA polymerase sigma factor (sigma-70 family)